jgi:hypothetical protein
MSFLLFPFLRRQNREIKQFAQKDTARGHAGVLMFCKAMLSICLKKMLLAVSENADKVF